VFLSPIGLRVFRSSLSLIGMLQKYGIWYVDPKPGNIMFGD
jgi:hypothetical protein